MSLNDQRELHEDLERLEQAVTDRVQVEDANNISRLMREHEIADFLSRYQTQAQRLFSIYKDADGSRARDLLHAGQGDAMDDFYSNLADIKDFHRRNPGEQVENLELAYRRQPPRQADATTGATFAFENLFSGEEALGRYFDLIRLHELYLNLLQGSRRITYIQYLDIFDVFTPPQCAIKRSDKMKDDYFGYVGDLAAYLEGFMRRTRPLEDFDTIFAGFDREFDAAWDADKVAGWSADDGATVKHANSASSARAAVEGTGQGIWCPDCQKEFTNDNVYRSHLSGKKHIRASEARKAAAASQPDDEEQQAQNGSNGSTANPSQTRLKRLKERAVAEREFRVTKLAAAMSSERADTKVNAERRAGMTERERAQELEALYAEAAKPAQQAALDGAGAAAGGGAGSDDEDDDKIYNPLKLPLSWDGKPIPYWLYKLHGLGVEFPCEICGNFVYMGRRAFDKHFTEARHIYGLKCLGITNTTLFREITSIDDALKLWTKLQQDKKDEKTRNDNLVEMEDSEGNTMPEKVFYDLQKQGLV